jgi:glycosyltransferase involved in cell wall biosynthesis
VQILNILLSAFACLPNYGTESGNGWNWAFHLVKAGHTVYVLTRALNRERIEKFLGEKPVTGLHFIYVEAPMAGLYNHKDRGVYYLAWQMAALKSGERLLKAVRIDLVHHVTYGSIHVPSPLWRLGLPIVFGPVGGGQTAVPSMLSYFGSGRNKERLRSLITRLLPWSPLHRRWLQRMSYVLASNQDTCDLARRCGCCCVEFSPDVGLAEANFASEPRRAKETHSPLQLLWVGRVLPRKALPLALDALALATQDVHLTIVGDGDEAGAVKAMIGRRGLEGKVSHSGRLPWNETMRQYLSHDALLFTSLRDSMGSQLIEAMALAMPVICLDLHGAREVVVDGAGYRVPVTTPEGTARALAAAIDSYALLGGEERANMSRHSWETARKMEWNSRVEKIDSIYERVMDASALNATPGDPRSSPSTAAGQ